MKKPLLIVIIILIAAALVSGGILIGYFLPHSEPTETIPVVTPGQIIETPTIPTENPITSPKENITPTNAIVGTWYGEKSMIFVGSLVMNAVFTPDGKASVSGKLTSSTFGDYDESAEGTWEQIDATTYGITVYGYTMNVKCDGKTISFSVNPYKLGLVDSAIADMDIELTLTKV